VEVVILDKVDDATDDDVGAGGNTGPRKIKSKSITMNICLSSPRSRILRTVDDMSTAQQEVQASQLEDSGLQPLLHMEEPDVGQFKK
jgi:hypothetical protein